MLAVLSFTAVVQAAAPAYRFHIEGQLLNQALQVFSDQSGLQIVYHTELLPDMRTHRVDGVYDAQTALNRLLRGTGLTARPVNARTFAVAIREASREIEITQFVPPSQIPPEYFDRPYYLGPDGDQAAYFAFTAALKNKEREGVVRWVMRKQPYVGALRAVDDYLMLFTLRKAEEVLSAKDLPKPSGRAPDKKELAMATQLVELLKGEFDPKEYKDEYRERVMEFVEKKAKGHKPRLKLVKSKRKTTSLDKVLSKSIETLKKQKKAA